MSEQFIGKRFGRLTVIGYEGKNDWGGTLWKCQCDCGNVKTILKYDLTRGNTTSCGCYRKEFRKRDLNGERFGWLTVLGTDDSPHNHPGQFWICKCDCGKEIVVRGDGLTSGHTKSCGCKNKRSTKHNKSHIKLYSIWKGMKQRCNNANNPYYKHYGMRGIKLCNEWNDDFESFYKWSIDNGYKDGLTIDRINNDGLYEPDNCRWATRVEQQANRRNTAFISYNGETHTIREWSEITGINQSTISNRRLKGLPPQEILKPVARCVCK